MNFCGFGLTGILILLISINTYGQQYRIEQRQQSKLSVDAIRERRFLSRHPKSLNQAGKGVPGAFLLGRPTARASQLKSRIRLTSAASAHQLTRPNSSLLPTIYPGIQFRPATPTGAIPASVVAGDFNKDGHMDYVVANGFTSDLWIYLGKGDGTFELPRIIPLTRGLSPVYMVTADLRGNGTLDLVVAEFDTSTIGVLLGKGDGTFSFEQTYTLPQPPAAIVVDDFNHDGKLDIASVMDTVNTSSSTVPYIATLPGDGTGSFGPAVITPNWGFYSSALNIASGDVNHDGLPDVVITGPGIENSQIFLNNGDGTFRPGAVLIENGLFNIELDARLADVNEDGCLDGLIADFNGYVWVRLGDCSGNFGALNYVQMGDSNSSLRLVDLNGDGHLDIVTAAITGDPDFGDVAGNTLSVSFGDGTGKFTTGRNYVGTGQSFSLAVADFNGDKKPDVVTANIDTDTTTLYLNDGSGGYGSPQGLFVGLVGVGVLNAPVSPISFSDLNSDGKPDVFLFDEGYNGEYFSAALLNDGTGRFTGPVVTDTGINIVSNWMGDYRLADLRNSGHPDLVAIGLTNAATTAASYILFMPGNGDGSFGKSTFTPTPGASGAMAVGDFNHDGKLDFVAVDSNPALSGKQVTAFLGNGDGTFRNAGATNFSDTAENVDRVFAADFNRDGKLDILVFVTGNGYWTTNSSIWEFLGNGDGTFQPGRQLFTPFEPMTMADMNGDHVPDIVRYDFFWPDLTTETWGPAKFITYLAQPDGTFTQASSYAPYAGVPQEVRPYLQDGDPTAVSFVADLNGDGKLDQIAFQRAAPDNASSYAQILMGNGDGTLTPTYDVFAFDKLIFYPKYGLDLDGDGFTDLLELDQFTSTMHVFRGGPAPALQLVLEQSQIASSGCGWVFPNIASTSDAIVTLSSSQAGVVLPASLTIPAGSLSQRFCFSLSPSYDWHQVFDVRAQLGSDTAVAYASQSYIVGFSEVLSPNADQVIYPTQSTAPVTITVTSSQGYSGTVHLSCEGLLPGTSCAFGSDSVTVSPTTPGSTTVIVNTTGSAQGQTQFLVIADDGTIEKRQPLNLTVQPLFVSFVGSSFQSTSPGTALGNFVIVGLPPFQTSCSGLPAGVSCVFSGDQLPYPSDTTMGLSLAIPSGVPAANYPFAVTVTSAGGTISTAANTTLSITDFSIQPPSPTSNWLLTGSSGYLTLMAQPVNSFDGLVNISCSLDFGGTCTGNSVGLAGTSPSSVSLQATVPSGVAIGTHTLTVTATYGSLTHTYSFPITVADYSGSLSSSAVTMTRGSSSSLTATLTATDGFTGSVDLNCTGSSPIACSFQPQTVQLTSTAPQTLGLTLTGSPFSSSPPAQTSRGALLSLSLLPVAIALGCASGRRTRRSWFFAMLLVFLIPCASCGGGSGSAGGGGGGGGGSNTYSVTVTASDVQLSSVRTIGTLKITVTH